VKIKSIISIILYFSFCQVQAQKEAWKWHFERYNGLDFSGDTVKTLSGCQFGESESSSSICDTNGNLLFYSNGITLYNRYNKIVKNGIDLGFPVGTNKTTSYQGALLLKHPDNDSLIYLFNTDNQGKSGGLVYSIINIYGNSDSGEVIKKKVKLTGAVNESISAVNHQNGRDIWVVCHKFGGELFYIYLLKKSGLTSCLVISQAGVFHSSTFGSDAQVGLKFSPNGKYLTHYQDMEGSTETLTFDNSSGVIGKRVFMNYWNIAFGFEYSPDSRYLFIKQSDSGLIQADLINETKIQITDVNINLGITQLQLASDGKIYSGVTGSRNLFVINNPILKGNFCNPVVKGNFLSDIAITAMPTFNQSYFYTPSIDYKYELNCISNNIQFWGKDTFKATAHAWLIKKKGKPTEGNYTSKNISHTFADTGKYEVRYIASNGNRHDTVIKTITLYPIVNKHFLGNDTIYAQGTLISKVLKAPLGMHCQLWQDGSGLSTYTADTVGVYTCKITNQSFCEITDTIVISSCNNSLTTPSIYRNRDTLYTFQTQADSFVWFRNNVQYKVTKEAFIRLTDTGMYRVVAAKKGYCNKSSNTYNVNKLGILTYQLSDYNIQLFPNPSSEQIFIKAENQFILQISDITGKIITVQKNIKSISLPKGIYFFNFNINEHLITEKVVIY
jgi:PKD repeat protein